MARGIGKLSLDYDPESLNKGIVHLGVGAFHRGHQAVYFDDLARLGETAWGIAGLNLQFPDLTRTHALQKGTYAVLESDGGPWRGRAVGSLRSCAFRAGGSQDVTGLAWLADPGVALVTLTVTEKGYCHKPGTNHLDEDGPVAQDLRDPSGARTAIGYLVEALRRRRDAGLPGVAVASCDNIPANGFLLQGVILDFARRVNPALADWIEESVSFPSSMVDRIVPALDEAALRCLEDQVGVPDQLGVVTEPSRQWVIEDRFVGARPPLERASVQVVNDVTPFERMKHRILNGAQTALAHLGWLSDYGVMSSAAADPVLASFAKNFMELQAHTLSYPPGEDLERYVSVTMERLSNPTIHHPLAQIGTDSSFKIRQRVALPAVDLLRKGDPAELHALTLAAWIQYVGGVASDGREVPVNEPQGGIYRALHAKAAGNATRLIDSFLGLELFPEELRDNPEFRRSMAEMLERLWRQTPRAILSDLSGPVSGNCKETCHA